MDVLALDFDGVLCDSSREVLVVAVDAYAEQQPDSDLLPALRDLRARVLGDGDFLDDPLYEGFAELLPLGNRAEDFGIALQILDRDLSVSSQEEYDARYDAVEAGWREAYHRRFYEAREALRSADPEAWLRLHRPYPELNALLHRHRDRSRMAVVTAKDERSVHLLLEALRLGELFEPQLVLDKEAGVHKVSHLRSLQERTGTPFTRITFVDDKVNHLQKTAVLGVRPVLAAWGFNTAREHALASRLGYRVATLADAGKILFEGVSS